MLIWTRPPWINKLKCKWKGNNWERVNNVITEKEIWVASLFVLEFPSTSSSIFKRSWGGCENGGGAMRRCAWSPKRVRGLWVGGVAILLQELPCLSSAPAVTGRRCPHSGTGQDFLAENRPSRTKTGVTRQQSERFGRAQCLNGANAEGYKKDLRPVFRFLGKRKNGPCSVVPFGTGSVGPQYNFFGALCIPAKFCRTASYCKCEVIKSCLMMYGSYDPIELGPLEPKKEGYIGVT